MSTLDLDPTVPDGVMVAGDAGWDAARRAWNLAVDQRPVGVARPRTTAELADTIRRARRDGHRIALQATGHGAATLGHLDDVLLVRTDRLQGVAVDPTQSRARVAAGTLAHELTATARPHGLTFLAGSAPDVGVVGYTLGGGVGWLARSHGLACNTVVSAEVVTADGEVLRVDADHEPELFWALRGGGGSFAAVAHLEMGLVELPHAHAGALLWPLERAEEVLLAWRDWTGTLPDEVTSIARLLRFPPLAELPDHLRGRSFVAVEAAFLTSEEEADRWLRALRSLRPTTDSFAPASATDLGQLHGDPDEPVPASTDHRLLGSLPDDAIDAILRVAGPGVETPLLAVDLRHLGGALGRSDAAHGVLDRIDAHYALFAVGLLVSPQLADVVPERLAALRDAVADWDAGREYLNFADRPTDPSRLFDPTRLARLRAVRGAYDPEARFVANHPIPLPG